jgi:hypothetical protein
MNPTNWPTNGYMPLLVQFSCPAVDSGTNSITSWQWFFGDGLGTGTGPTNSYIYTWSKSKTFSPTLYATNVNGTAVVATGPKISANYPPIGFTASPTNGPVPLSVQFKAPATDTLGVTITNWNWTFGDGAISILQNPSHTYTNAGIFSPALLATQHSGHAVVLFWPSAPAGLKLEQNSNLGQRIGPPAACPFPTMARTRASRFYRRRETCFSGWPIPETLEAEPIRRAVLDGLRDVVAEEVFGAGQAGDGSAEGEIEAGIDERRHHAVPRLVHRPIRQADAVVAFLLACSSPRACAEDRSEGNDIRSACASIKGPRPHSNSQ